MTSTNLTISTTSIEHCSRNIGQYNLKGQKIGGTGIGKEVKPFSDDMIVYSESLRKSTINEHKQ